MEALALDDAPRAAACGLSKRLAPLDERAVERGAARGALAGRFQVVPAR